MSQPRKTTTTHSVSIYQSYYFWALVSLAKMHIKRCEEKPTAVKIARLIDGWIRNCGEIDGMTLDAEQLVKSSISFEPPFPSEEPISHHSD